MPQSKFLPTVLLTITITATAHPTDQYIKLEKIQNTRDLGGIETADGHQITPHRLYRSGNPSQASQQDIKTLQAMHLDAIIDFRAASEKQPNEKAFADQFPWQSDPVLAGNLSPSAIIPLLKRSTPEQMHDFMLNLYRQFPSNYQPQFAHFLKLAEDNKT